MPNTKSLEKKAQGLQDRLELAKKKAAEDMGVLRSQIVEATEALQQLEEERERKLACWEKKRVSLDFADIHKLAAKHDKAVAKIMNTDHFKNQLLVVIQSVL